MKRFMFGSRKRLLVTLAVLAVAAAAAVGAYAYFTAAGSGTGQFTSGQIGSVTITSDTAGPLYPQTNASLTTPLTVRVTNNGANQQYVGAISGVVDPSSLPAGCSASWFTIAPISAPGLIAPGESDYSSSIILNDDGGNQNACANHTFTIDWTSASG